MIDRAAFVMGIALGATLASVACVATLLTQVCHAR